MSMRSYLLSRPLSPLDADASMRSYRSGHMTARSIRSACTGNHHKVPLLPWYKRDVFAGALACMLVMMHSSCHSRSMLPVAHGARLWVTTNLS